MMDNQPVTRAELDHIRATVRQCGTFILRVSENTQDNVERIYDTRIGVLDLQASVHQRFANLDQLLGHLNQRLAHLTHNVATLQVDMAEGIQRDFAQRVPFDMLRQEVHDLRDQFDTQISSLLQQLNWAKTDRQGHVLLIV